jgi:hypothetical protein
MFETEREDKKKKKHKQKVEEREKKKTKMQKNGETKPDGKKRLRGKKGHDIMPLTDHGKKAEKNMEKAADTMEGGCEKKNRNRNIF